jgi:hypothetical protein
VRSAEILSTRGRLGMGVAGASIVARAGSMVVPQKPGDHLAIPSAPMAPCGHRENSKESEQPLRAIRSRIPHLSRSGWWTSPLQAFSTALLRILRPHMQLGAPLSTHGTLPSAQPSRQAVGRPRGKGPPGGGRPCPPRTLPARQGTPWESPKSVHAPSPPPSPCRGFCHPLVQGVAKMIVTPSLGR